MPSIDELRDALQGAGQVRDAASARVRDLEGRAAALAGERERLQTEHDDAGTKHQEAAGAAAAGEPADVADAKRTLDAAAEQLAACSAGSVGLQARIESARAEFERARVRALEARRALARELAGTAELRLCIATSVFARSKRQWHELAEAGQIPNAEPGPSLLKRGLSEGLVPLLAAENIRPDLLQISPTRPLSDSELLSLAADEAPSTTTNTTAQPAEEAAQ
jgi:hypothetical protein